jgi:diguanylate cyclase (GGDEF)-like protein/PAS domain S-box-containing protein
VARGRGSGKPLDAVAPLVEDVFAGASIGMGILRPDGVWLRANRWLCQITGWSESELQARKLADVIDERDLDERRGQLERLLRRGVTAYRVETRLIERSGGLTWVQLSLSAVRDRLGRATHFVVLVEDISRRKRLEQTLERERFALRDAQQIAHVGSWSWDTVTNEATWSAEMYRIFDRLREQGAATGDRFMGYVHVDDRDRVAAVRLEAVSAGRSFELDYRIVLATGGIRIIQSHGRPDPQRPKVYVGTVQDITVLRDAELRARRERDYAAAITRSMREGFLLTRNSVIVDANPALCKLTGFACDELLGARAPYPFQAPDTDAPITRQRSLAGAGEHIDLEASLVRRDGTRFDASITVVDARAEDGELLGKVWTIRDISEQKRDALELQRLASHDPLTGLANHRTFHEQLVREVSRAKRHERPLSVAILDFDGFKAINDHHGHPVGDRILREAAERLRLLVRDGELLARVGGDEFAWILPDADGEGGFQAAERARLAISTIPFMLAGTLTLSVGVCELGVLADAARLYALADEALYTAKRAGRNQTVRHPAASTQ